MRAIRSSLGLTQEQLAEYMRVSSEALQSWETGRRPLVNLRFTELRAIHRTLHAADADTELLRVWDYALEADSILDGFGTVDPSTHPLGVTVPDRLLTELLAWPLGGPPPKPLAPQATRPLLPAGIRDDLTAGLRDATDRSLGNDTEAAVMLRRQIRFLVRGVPGGPRPRAVKFDRWTPRWAEARSEAVAHAIDGDPMPLWTFARDGLATEELESANLNYWAYWVGEIPARWSADSSMVESERPWSGESLLASLVTGLESAPYRELCVYTLHALVPRRPGLVERPATAKRLASSIDVARDNRDGMLSPEAIRRLDQVTYRIGRTA